MDPNKTPGPAAPLDLIPLEQVPDLLPHRRGRKHHRSTIFRWAADGVAGVTLRTVRMGGTKCTRREWLHEFFAELARIRDGLPESPAPRQRARERLARHGLASKKRTPASLRVADRGSVALPEAGDGQA